MLSTFLMLTNLKLGFTQFPVRIFNQHFIVFGHVNPTKPQIQKFACSKNVNRCISPAMNSYHITGYQGRFCKRVRNRYHLWHTLVVLKLCDKAYASTRLVNVSVAHLAAKQTATREHKLKRWLHLLKTDYVLRTLNQLEALLQLVLPHFSAISKII